MPSAENDGALSDPWAAVRKLHSRMGPDRRKETYAPKCAHCQRAWPCPTLRALPPSAEVDAGVAAYADELDRWCQEHCRACRDPEFAARHSHDCGITRRDVVERLRALTHVIPPANAPSWRHCRWFDPHPPVPVPGSEAPVRAAGGRLGAVCATCGEALTSDVLPPGVSADG